MRIIVKKVLLSVCTYMVIWHFNQTQGVPCGNALAVYTIHGLSACKSKQVMVGKVSRESRKMEPLRFLAVMLSTILSGTVGNF